MISIVIPVYQSEETLSNLYERLINIFKKINTEYEIILVDDHSEDRSWNIIKELSNKDFKVKGIRMIKNFGEHNALLCGIRLAKGQSILTMDDDLQHPPEELIKLLDEFKKGFDLVYGIPIKESRGLFRNFGSVLVKFVLQKVMKISKARNISSYRIFKTSLRNSFSEFQNPSVNIDSLLKWGTDNIGVVKVKHDKKNNKLSRYNIIKLYNFTFNMITGFSTMPLKISSLLGLAFSFLGFATLLYILVIYFTFGSEVKGFYFLASIIAIFSGVQLFVIGVFGEYLSRIYLKSLSQPPYIIKEKTNDNNQEK